MSLEIRRETEKDYPAVANLHKVAFKGPDEAKLVDELRKDAAAFIPALSLVGDLAGVVVAHVLFTRLVTDPPLRAVALAPVAVVPSLQKRGIGSQLLSEAMGRVRGLGYQVAVVVGDPGFYARFGFSQQLGRRVQCPYSGAHLAMAELEKGVLDKVPVLKVTYPAAFSSV